MREDEEKGDDPDANFYSPGPVSGHPLLFFFLGTTLVQKSVIRDLGLFILLLRPPLMLQYVCRQVTAEQSPRPTGSNL